MYASRDDKILYLKADENLKYGQVQKGIEIARQAGARMVASITEAKAPQKLFDAEE
jgi:biopolymer transport protein ExbD